MQVLVEMLLCQVRLENCQEVVLIVVDVVVLFCCVSEACIVQLVEKKIILYVMFIEVNVVVELVLLEQVLGNLLDNVIDFIFESGCIMLSVEVDQEYVMFKVLDIGSGIFDYVFLCIFECFYFLFCVNG